MRLATVPIGRPSPIGDHAVGLVPREEAIEQLAAGLIEARESVADIHRLLEVREPRVSGDLELAVARGVPPCRGDPVEAQTPRHLGDPRPDRLVVAERLEPLVDAKERVLEDILGIRLRVAGTPERRSHTRTGSTARRARPRLPGRLRDNGRRARRRR